MHTNYVKIVGVNRSAEYISNISSTQNPKVPGEIKRSRDLRGRRWSWTFKIAQKRS